MKHEILFLGKTKDKYLREGISEFQSRLKYYTTIAITTIKDSSNVKTGHKAILNQGKSLLKAVSHSAVKVVLDEKGKQYSSRELSELIQRWEMQGVKHIAYLIGGPEGHSPEVLKSADIKFSMSKMTFTHDMVRLMLIEQLYRAYTIKAGEKYHK